MGALPLPPPAPGPVSVPYGGGINNQAFQNPNVTPYQVNPLLQLGTAMKNLSDTIVGHKQATEQAAQDKLTKLAQLQAQGWPIDPAEAAKWARKANLGIITEGPSADQLKLWAQNQQMSAFTGPGGPGAPGVLPPGVNPTTPMPSDQPPGGAVPPPGAAGGQAYQMSPLQKMGLARVPGGLDPSSPFAAQWAQLQHQGQMSQLVQNLLGQEAFEGAKKGVNLARLANDTLEGKADPEHATLMWNLMGNNVETQLVAAALGGSRGQNHNNDYIQNRVLMNAIGMGPLMNKASEWAIEHQAEFASPQDAVMYSHALMLMPPGQEQASILNAHAPVALDPTRQAQHNALLNNAHETYPYLTPYGAELYAAASERPNDPNSKIILQNLGKINSSVQQAMGPYQVPTSKGVQFNQDAQKIAIERGQLGVAQGELALHNSQFAFESLYRAGQAVQQTAGDAWTKGVQLYQQGKTNNDKAMMQAAATMIANASSLQGGVEIPGTKIKFQPAEITTDTLGYWDRQGLFSGITGSVPGIRQVPGTSPATASTGTGAAKGVTTAAPEPPDYKLFEPGAMDQTTAYLRSFNQMSDPKHPLSSATATLLRDPNPTVQKIRAMLDKDDSFKNFPSSVKDAMAAQMLQTWPKTLIQLQ